MVTKYAGKTRGKRIRAEGWVKNDYVVLRICLAGVKNVTQDLEPYVD